MARFSQGWRRGLQFGLAAMLLLILFAVALLWVEHQVFAPKRLALHSYHLQRLNQPEKYGLRIRAHDCLDGLAPCLLVEADGQAEPGERGALLRQQLHANGVELAPYGTHHATLVMLHGRKARKESLLGVAERFVAAGFRCIVADLPAHGESPLEQMGFGSLAVEQQLPAAVLADIRARFQLPDEPTFLWGMSMGGAVAVSAAAAQPEAWSGVVIVSSFAELEVVLQHLLGERYAPWLQPVVAWLDRSRQWRGKPTLHSMRPQQWAADLTMPVLMVHGDADEYVPMAQGQALFAAIPSEDKQWLTVKGGTHHTVLVTPMPLYAAMSEWLLGRGR